MSHTTEQARELWCPMVRLAGCLPSGEVEPGQANCIANKCAMWQWAPQEDDEIRGYCGLAGRPEVM